MSMRMERGHTELEDQQQNYRADREDSRHLVT